MEPESIPPGNSAWLVVNIFKGFYILLIPPSAKLAQTLFHLSDLKMGGKEDGG
jgi:hypothetical protein